MLTCKNCNSIGKLLPRDDNYCSYFILFFFFVLFFVVLRLHSPIAAQKLNILVGSCVNSLS